MLKAHRENKNSKKFVFMYCLDTFFFVCCHLTRDIFIRKILHLFLISSTRAKENQTETGMKIKTDLCSRLKNFDADSGVLERATAKRGFGDLDAPCCCCLVCCVCGWRTVQEELNRS